MAGRSFAAALRSGSGLAYRSRYLRSVSYREGPCVHLAKPCSSAVRTSAVFAYKPVPSDHAFRVSRRKFAVTRRLAGFSAAFTERSTAAPLNIDGVRPENTSGQKSEAD